MSTSETTLRRTEATIGKKPGLIDGLRVGGPMHQRWETQQEVINVDRRIHNTFY